MCYLLENNSRLNSTLVLHTLQTLTPLLQLECLIHNACNLHFPGVEVIDGSREHVSLREGTQDRDLVAKDLGWWPGDAGRGAVDSVDDELASTTDVVDGIFEDFWGTSGFNDDVEAVGVVGL